MHLTLFNAALLSEDKGVTFLVKVMERIGVGGLSENFLLFDPDSYL